MSHPVSPLAKRVLPLVDLTNVFDDCSAADVAAMCEKAKNLPVPVAAICIRPAFVAQTKAALACTPIKVATVINFPDAQISPTQAGTNLDAAAQAAQTRQAVADGADEIDVVFAWKSFIDGDHTGPVNVIKAVKEACGPARLKVILESGVFPDLQLLHTACDLVIDAGADFLKTSTTRVEPAATLEAVRVMCEASKAVGKSVAVKASGGVRTGEQASAFIDVVGEVMGLNWVAPDNFRIGASKLVDNLLAPPAASAAVAPAVGY